ncbi:MAG: hypothetical protein ACRDT7_19490, partial [Microbacterium sp.]
MAGIEIADERRTSLVPGAHRVIRTVDATEGPFAGTLVTDGERVVVRVDAASLSGWVGWRFSGAEHIAAPLDVSRHSGGHDALLPWCTDRVLGFLGRRTAAGAGVAPGECSTVVISLLRGLDELGQGAEGVCTGVWWLTDGGRPLFVIGEGPDARAAVVEILRQLREHSTDRVLKRALRVIEEGLGKTLAQPRLPRKLTEAWEQELLSVAAAQPLERGTHAPERARDIARAVTSRDVVTAPAAQRLRADRSRTREARRVVDGVGVVRGAAHAIAREIRGWLEAARRIRSARDTATAKSMGRSEARGHLRRRSLLVAAAAAGLVLVGGLLLPNGDASGEAPDATERVSSEDPSSARDEPQPQGTPAAADAPGEDDGMRPVPVAEEDPAVAAAALLKTIADCRARSDSSCADAVAGDSEGVMDALGASEPVPSSAELVDSYGDVAVVRLGMDVSSGDATQMMVVLIRAEEKWLVRDVY